MKAATRDKLDSCPVCGERIEASMKIYLGEVVIERAQQGRGIVTDAVDESEHLGCEIEFYGPNDCCTEAINKHLTADPEDGFNLFPIRIEAAGFTYVF